MKVTIMTLYSDKWSWEVPHVEGESPSARAAHGCAVIGNKMFIFGGLSPSGPLNDLFVLDTAAGG